MSDATHKTLFSVIQTFDEDGNSFFQVEWHPDMYPILDEIVPDGAVTDRLIDIAEELTAPPEC